MTKIISSVWECVFWCICIASTPPNRKYKRIADMNELYDMGAAKTGPSAVLADGNFGFFAKKKFFSIR